MKKYLRRLYYSASPEICLDICAWAKKKGLPFVPLTPPVIDHVEKFAQEDPLARVEIDVHRAGLERWQTLVGIEGAIVRDYDGIVELPDGKICYEGNWWINYLKKHPSYKKRFELRKRRLQGDYYSLLCLWGSTYFHWFQDVLPRLHTAMPHLPKDTRFLINENPKEYQIKSLKAFGIDESKLELQPQRMNTRIERLWFASPIGHTGLTSPTILRLVADRIRKFYVTEKVQLDSGRMWISREKARNRRVANEKELQSVLKHYGIEKVFAEDHSFFEQLKIYYSAQLIVGPHGAGLVNTMFCKEKTKVCEVAPPRVPPCYLISCQGLGLDFTRMFANPLSEGQDTDMDLDVAKLAEYLSK